MIIGQLLLASRLRKSNGFTARIELYSPSHKRYIKIKNSGQFGDFLSNRLRLRFQCEKVKKATQYKPHIILETV